MTLTQADPHDVQQAHRATGLLATFNRAGILAAADVHVAQRLARLGPEGDQRVHLAAALAVRAVRHGSVCLDLAQAASTTALDGATDQEVAALPWPDPQAWAAALTASQLIALAEDGPADRPLRFVDGLLYLDRYWRQQQSIAAYVDRAAQHAPHDPDPAAWTDALTRLFPRAGADRQRLAAIIAAHRRLTLLTGGPGTGKTTTVAKVLALLQDQAQGRLRTALAAPTGKAAARLQEAAAQAAQSLSPEDQQRIGPMTASTLHRLLGSKPGTRTRFRHDRDNRLPYDVVVVDEASMVSLTMMSRLVDALRPDARLILVGDPDQLASVEVGAVLGDLVNRPAPPGMKPNPDLDTALAADFPDLSSDERDRAVTAGVVRLAHVYRFSTEIQALADAIRSGTPETVLDVLAKDHPGIDYLDVDPAAAPAALDSLRRDVVAAGRELVEAARSGDAPAALSCLERHRLLCAHRDGPYGVARWGRQLEEWLTEAIDGYARDGDWYIGRPLLITSNDYQLRLFNGDTGVVIDRDGQPRAAFRRDGEVTALPTSRLSAVQTVHALSVHRSQGSQFDAVTVILPPADSPLLTRELLYTAVTRAKRRVRIIGTHEALSRAVRRPIVRASGLSAHRRAEAGPPR